MEFHTRCRCWFILQVVAIIVCYRGKASCSTKISQGCVGSQHDLRCPSTKVIRVTGIYQGISSCKGASCCIEEPGCSQQLSESYHKSVLSRCDDKQNCSLDIDFAKSPCTSGWWLWKTTIDGYAYEIITYFCRDDPKVLSTVTTSSNSVRPASSDGIVLYTAEQLTSGVTTKEADPSMFFVSDNVTTSVETHTKLYENNTEEDDESEGGQMEDDSNSSLSEILPVVVVFISLTLLIAILVIVVVMYRRRKLQHSNLLHPIELKNIDNSKTETAIYANETQGIGQPANSYHLPPVYGLSGKAKPTTDEDPTFYSDVEIRKIDWKQNEFDGKTTTGLKMAQNAASNSSHNTGTDVYTVVNKPSSHAAVSSASRTGISEKKGREGLSNTGDGFPVRAYRLPSPEVATDIYVNEASAVTETVTRKPSLQDDGGVTVIENDLYYH